MDLMNINQAIKNKEQKTFELANITKSFKISALFIIVIIALVFFIKYESNTAEDIQTLKLISNPKVNDIYFLDFRLLSNKLRPTEKYRIAKVVAITGETITLLYGRFFYQYQQAAINSIQYSQLSYKDYFESKRYNIPHSEIIEMHSNQALYLAKRPIRNKLFGSLVGPTKVKDMSSNLTYGKKENRQGENFLNEQFSETNIESAFELFQRSANLGYPKGQVNLAEMYINGQFVQKDFEKALYWLKQASLQSDKPAILKYDIICKQVVSCNIIDFYQELTDYGVNIRVRKLDFTLSH
jgi:hypothetical protein